MDGNALGEEVGGMVADGTDEGDDVGARLGLANGFYVWLVEGFALGRLLGATDGPALGL